MKTKEEIFETLRGLLVEHFELDAEAIRLDARLYEDLEIDSIDAVDLLAELRSELGRRIDPQAFRQIRTVGDVVDTIDRLLNEPSHA
ncbi:acyl carrier protein [Pedomonas mirosovicensis]|uniref:acyl carrier protein n=1 Tax=Pedomonas mirosovicensis TaxID=2908641 RepID=UPI002168336C|nr:acyl carrier protein [Pedomonas mirosovicensis]MCH8686372.1 acyl carrier protein [Pedomonas mirosovicensis]